MEFVLINTNNFLDLFSWHGGVQWLVLSGSLIVSYVWAYLLLRKTKQLLPQHNPIWHGSVHKIIRVGLLAILSAVGGAGLSFITKVPAILLYSIAILAMLLTFTQVILYTVDYSLRQNKYHRLINKTLYLVLLMVILFWTTNLDVLLANSLSKIVLHFGKSQLSLWDFLHQTIIITLVLAALLLFTVAIDGWIKNLSNLDNNLRHLLLRTSKVGIVLITGFIVLPSLGFDLTALSVLGGAVGVGIGFGFQKIASNFLSGFILLLDKSVKIGDRVVINNVSGTISQITTRYVVMQGFDGSEMLIPNEKFITDLVINQTYSNTDIGVELVVAVGYSSDLVVVLDTLRECIASIPEIKSDKEPSVYIQKLNDSGIDIFLRVWPKDALNASTVVRNKLNIAIVAAFRAKQIEIPFPKRDISILK